MNPQEIQQTIQAIIDGLTPLAQKLQIPLEKVFEYAIKQNYVYAIWFVLADFLGIVIGLSLLVFGLKKYNIFKKKYGTHNCMSEDDIFIALLPTIIGGLILATSVIIFFASGQETLSRFVNPEYMALQDIAKLILQK